MQRFTSRKVLLPVAVAALVSACGGDGGGGTTTPPPAESGTLNLTVNGVTGSGDVDAVSTAEVVRNLTEGANTLPAGTWDLVVNGIRQDGDIVDSLLAGGASPMTVTIAAGSTRNATATYDTSLEGRLWVPGASATLHGFDGAQLAAGGADPGSVTITGAGAGPFNTAFDAGGNMWVADFGGSALLFYSVDQLGASGSGPPDATITDDGSGSLDGPVGLAFDANGNLWVGNFIGNTLVQYSAATLAAAVAAGGSSSPPTDVTVSSAELVGPYGHALDSDGNLWVANNGGGTLVQFAAADLAASGAPTPTESTNAKTSGTLVNPRAPAFDADGNLWVASRGTDELVQYTLDSTTGDPTAQADVSVTPADPSGLAFDNAGDLWVADGVGNAVLKFTSADLLDGGGATAVTSLTGAGDFGGVLISFSPPPADLPLAQ